MPSRIIVKFIRDLPRRTLFILRRPPFVKSSSPFLWSQVAQERAKEEKTRKRDGGIADWLQFIEQTQLLVILGRFLAFPFHRPTVPVAVLDPAKPAVLNDCLSVNSVHRLDLHCAVSGIYVA